jgi:hypothetical protein
MRRYSSTTSRRSASVVLPSTFSCIASTTPAVPFSATRGQHLLAAGPGVVGIGLGAGVGQDQAGEALREEAGEGERDVAAHRHAADGHRWVTPIRSSSSATLRAKLSIDGSGQRGRLAEAGQVGEDQAGVRGQLGELRPDMRRSSGKAWSSTRGRPAPAVS